MGLIVMAKDWYPDTPESEFDVCTLCGHPTTLLVSCRVGDLLVDFCGICIEALRAGYLEMMSRRMTFDLRDKAET